MRGWGGMYLHFKAILNDCNVNTILYPKFPVLGENVIAKEVKLSSSCFHTNSHKQYGKYEEL